MSTERAFSTVVLRSVIGLASFGASVVAWESTPLPEHEARCSYATPHGAAHDPGPERRRRHGGMGTSALRHCAII